VFFAIDNNKFFSVVELVEIADTLFTLRLVPVAAPMLGVINWGLVCMATVVPVPVLSVTVVAVSACPHVATFRFETRVLLATMKGAVGAARLDISEPESVNWVPAYVLAVIALPAKLPEASLRTIVDTLLMLVAALARLAPAATLAALTPPTVETTVAARVPVTSPETL
jgi:hypothetical protein